MAGHSGRMSIGTYLTALRWVDETVLAAGQLRQGILLPRRCKLLPRQFVLAVTQTRVVAFASWGAESAIGIKPGIRASFARSEVELTGLTNGPASRRATMRVRDERFRVSRPHLSDDSETDELFALLGGLPPLRIRHGPAWAAFSL